MESSIPKSEAENPDVVLERARRRAVVQMLSLLASFAAFVIVVEVVARRPGFTPPADAGLEAVRIVFYAIAIAMVFVINVVQGFALKAEKSDDVALIAARLTRVNVVVSALAEAPAIMGFVLFLVWGYHTDFYVLVFVSLYLMVRHFPFRGQWVRFAKSRMRDKWPGGPVDA